VSYARRDWDKIEPIIVALKDRGILPWVDKWDMVPGKVWQDVLRNQLRNVKAAVVFIGPRGSGPWQQLELRELIDQFTKGKRTIIPAILPGRKAFPDLPSFLGQVQAVDFRLQSPDPVDQLVYGITGVRPAEFNRRM